MQHCHTCHVFQKVKGLTHLNVRMNPYDDISSKTKFCQTKDLMVLRQPKWTVCNVLETEELLFLTLFGLHVE